MTTASSVAGSRVAGQPRERPLTEVEEHARVAEPEQVRGTGRAGPIGVCGPRTDTSSCIGAQVSPASAGPAGSPSGSARVALAVAGRARRGSAPSGWRPCRRPGLSWPRAFAGLVVLAGLVGLARAVGLERLLVGWRRRPRSPAGRPGSGVRRLAARRPRRFDRSASIAPVAAVLARRPHRGRRGPSCSTTGLASTASRRRWRHAVDHRVRTTTWRVDA